MPTLKLTVQADLDGVPLSGFPVVRRVHVAEVQAFETLQAPTGEFLPLPLSELSRVAALILRSDQVIVLRLNGQSDMGINMEAGGMVVLFDVALDAGAAVNATVWNPGTLPVTLRGVAGGS
jgi:hypothetical protein